MNFKTAWGGVVRHRIICPQKAFSMTDVIGMEKARGSWDLNNTGRGIQLPPIIRSQSMVGTQNHSPWGAHGLVGKEKRKEQFRF